MGTHVFTKMRIFAVRAPFMPEGLGYWTEEWGYCKKDGPMQESSCVMAMGDRTRILKRLFGIASSLPGGSVQTRSGYASAKHMLDKWIALLDNPEVLETPPIIHLENAKDGFYTPITDATRGRVVEILRASGFDQFAEQAGNGKALELNLGECFHAMAEMTRVRPGDPTNCNSMDTEPYVLPWRILQTHGFAIGNTRHEEHKPKGPSASPVKPWDLFSYALTAGKIDGYMRLDEAGKLSDADSWWVMESRAIHEAWKQEALTPGHYKELFKAMAKSKEDSQSLPLEATIAFPAEVPSADWRRNTLAEIRAAAGGGTDGEFVTTYGKILEGLDYNSQYNIFHQLGGLLKFELPAKLAACSTEQQSLFI